MDPFKSLDDAMLSGGRCAGWDWSLWNRLRARPLQHLPGTYAQRGGQSRHASLPSSSSSSLLLLPLSSMLPALPRRGQASKGRGEPTRSHAGDQAWAAEARQHRNTTQYGYHGRPDRLPSSMSDIPRARGRGEGFPKRGINPETWPPWWDRKRLVRSLWDDVVENRGSKFATSAAKCTALGDGSGMPRSVGDRAGGQAKSLTRALEERKFGWEAAKKSTPRSCRCDQNQSGYTRSTQG
ncbi:hypothetical protein B0T14DRAFT_55511 [Immersiella caudata]|uniref:Uncharacterized protein n=1 Tax=Immersiella caudata TaxID=314043 RepID=A0AA39XHF8_9PEZI|nr:hypothetical protein B0T14DRAFT_55511 [Immersiella caudata]